MATTNPIMRLGGLARRLVQDRLAGSLQRLAGGEIGLDEFAAHWRDRAPAEYTRRQTLKAAERYITLLPRFRGKLRYFCLLPFFFGVKTVALSRSNPPPQQEPYKCAQPSWSSSVSP